ncbi:hypothetical protein ASNO1_78190 [Corallococcus caeni]|uniref:Uncharacterized protein n=1 Tax=Corallococcus caeni TaxID=3082388 RepID=A0ABQ6R5K4_9BACT|nr:hypothetical protein ASNO1_78190 [Corallococcus sp. NO1]
MNKGDELSLTRLDKNLKRTDSIQTGPNRDGTIHPYGKNTTHRAPQ